MGRARNPPGAGTCLHCLGRRAAQARRGDFSIVCVNPSQLSHHRFSPAQDVSERPGTGTILGMATDLPVSRDDRVLAYTRVLSLAIAPFLVVASLLLCFFPGDTRQLFAWTIRPTITPTFLVFGGWLANRRLARRPVVTSSAWARLPGGSSAWSGLSRLPCLIWPGRPKIVQNWTAASALDAAVLATHVVAEDDPSTAAAKRSWLGTRRWKVGMVRGRASRRGAPGPDSPGKRFSGRRRSELNPRPGLRPGRSNHVRGSAIGTPCDPREATTSGDARPLFRNCMEARSSACAALSLGPLECPVSGRDRGARFARVGVGLGTVVGRSCRGSTGFRARGGQTFTCLGRRLRRRVQSRPWLSAVSERLGTV